jgi:hypothetical protein
MKPTIKANEGTLAEFFQDFKKIYERFGVEVIGFWDNLYDPLETYLITAYRDADHYAEIVNKMRKDSTYRSLSEDLLMLRESIEEVSLKSIM